MKKAVFEDKRFAHRRARPVAVDRLAGRRGQAAAISLTAFPSTATTTTKWTPWPRQVVEHFCAELESPTKTSAAGPSGPASSPSGFHIAMGSFTGATPDGRYAGDVLGNGITPTNGNARARAHGRDELGDQAPHRRWSTNGANLNMRFPGQEDQAGKPHCLSSRPTSRKAAPRCSSICSTQCGPRATRRSHPEKYRDLIVRVSGYSAEFTGLARSRRMRSSANGIRF